METSKYDTAKMAVKSSHSSLFQCLRLAYKDSCKTKTVYLQKLLKYFKELQRISQHGKLNFVTFPTANFENSLTLHWVGRRDFSAGKADRLRVRRPKHFGSINGSGKKYFLQATTTLDPIQARVQW